MAWERFQYLCRAALVEKTDGSPQSQIDQINKKPAATLYGRLPTSSLPRKLLDSIKSLEGIEATNLALKTYARLDPTYLIEKPQTLRRIPVYLLWIVFTYVIIVSIYKLKVFPQILETYESMAWPLPNSTMWFIEYGSSIAYILSLVMILMVIASFGLNKLASLEKDYSQHSLVRYFCPSYIKDPYLKLIGFLYFPVTTPGQTCTGLSMELQSHLEDAAKSGLLLEEEISTLFRLEAQKFTSRCEAGAKFLTVVTVLVIIFSIYQFVYGVYAPIFSLGKVV